MRFRDRQETCYLVDASKYSNKEPTECLRVPEKKTVGRRRSSELVVKASTKGRSRRESLRTYPAQQTGKKAEPLSEVYSMTSPRCSFPASKLSACWPTLVCCKWPPFSESLVNLSTFAITRRQTRKGSPFFYHSLYSSLYVNKC